MQQEILIAITGFGILQSLFFAFCLFQQRQNLANRLLAFLFVAISIRISKTFLVYYLDYQSHLYGIGYAAFLVIMPLLYFYVRAFLQQNFRWRRQYWGHFALALGLYSTCFYVPATDKATWDLVYNGIVVFELSYLLLTLAFLWRQYRQSGKDASPKFTWLTHLLICVFGIWLMYFLNSSFRVHAYMAGAASYACLLAVTAFTAFKHLDWFLPRATANMQDSIVDEREAAELRRKLYRAMAHDRLFLQSDLKLASLAAHVDTTPHHLSQFINQVFRQNFSEWVNTFRIQEAQRLLVETDQKVLAVALESGFNSLSVFNPAFKRATGVTPSQFRKKHQFSVSKL